MRTFWLIVAAMLLGTSGASVAGTRAPVASFEATVRCLALDDTYWAMIMSAGAGERTAADMAWRNKQEAQMYAEGAKKGLTRDQVNDRYSAVNDPLQATFLNDAQAAERKRCRAGK